MTEDDAKTKWCPFIRFVPRTRSQHSFSNRAGVIRPDSSDAAVSAETKCIGAAWRGGGPVPAVVDDAVDGEGYCGLAGHPQGVA
jgi:hypothetical protein